MRSGQFFTCLMAISIVLVFAENKQTTTVAEDSEKNHRSPRISSEFGYNILNSDRETNHFRQEHRDVNGVVRGSYGFKTPSGAYRFVQYVADDKGFRAHVSSNEQGVGKQNPASVSINRFEHQPSLTEDRTKPPISQLRKQNALQGGLMPEAQLPRYDFYSPVQTGTADGNQNFQVIDPFSYNPGRQEINSNRRQTPVDRFVDTRFFVPNDILSIFREHERNSINRFSQVPSSDSTVPTDHPLAQDYSAYKNPLYGAQVLSNSNYIENAFRIRANNFLKSSSNYPQFLASLLQRPQQKVHTSLPDCDSASSAILCKPPLFTETGSKQSDPGDEGLDLDDILRTSPSQKFLPDVDSFSQDLSSAIHELPSQTNENTPPPAVPGSYPMRSDIYKNYFNYLHEHQNSETLEKNCRKHLLAEENARKDYLVPSESHKPVKDGYNENIRTTPFDQSLEQKNSFQHLRNRDEEFYSSLIKVIKNDESLNKLKNMLLQVNQSPAHSTSATAYPKLSLLGVLILPNDIVKELTIKQKDGKLNTTKVPESPDEKNLSSFGDDIFESDIVDEADQHLDVNSKDIFEINHSKEHVKDNHTLEDHNLGNKTDEAGSNLPAHVPLIRSNPFQTSQCNNSHIEIPAQTVTSSKFHVYDNQRVSDKENKDKSANSSEDNWRKILEDEISKEMREAFSHQDSASGDELTDSSTNSESGEKSYDNQYNLNKHIGPLYDSTGKLIQPENVPIHIHRFNPPSGLTSIPWKYSIPRPGPPRSIVVPPKPPTLS